MASDAQFESILFEHPEPGADDAEQPDYFGDLNLDQVLVALTAGRGQYRLEPFFFAPLHDVAAVRYRQEVLRDLERPEVRDAVTTFATGMTRMQERLELVRDLRYALQQQAWFLDAVRAYCDAVRTLAGELPEHELASDGVRALREYLADYTGSERFTSLAAETEELKEALAAVRYSLHIDGAKVTVSHYEGEPDYSAQVQEAFARFAQGSVESYLARLPDAPDMNHVEAQVLDRVARLNPDVFGRLTDYCERHRDFRDATVARFDREVQLYLAYLDLVAPLRDAGLSFCCPRVSGRSKEIGVENTFDLALAIKLVAEGGEVVGNDLRLEGPERVFVVTGPNNGGKTTFARTFGQLHHLASLGLLVPGSEAGLFLPDRIYTHFEREEDIETLRGKFEDELVRVHDVLDHATERSVIVMNESFSSTTLHDALYVGSEVMRRVLELDALGVYVTFVDEIASLSDATVSMVAQIVPENPAERTFKVVRKRADGLAYAWALAEKYGLTYESLRERIAA